MVCKGFVTSKYAIFQTTNICCGNEAYVMSTLRVQQSDFDIVIAIVRLFNSFKNSCKYFN